MDVVVRGKNLPLTEAIERYVHEKVGRLARYWSAIQRVEVTCQTEPTRGVEARHHVEANVRANGLLLHGEYRAGDLYVAIDGLVERLERQIERQRGHLRGRRQPAVWAEPTGLEAEFSLTLLRSTNYASEKDLPGAFGDLPNLLGWPVHGPQDKQVGTVTGLYVHPDRQEIGYLAVAAPDSGEFTVPIAETAIDTVQECLRLRRNLGQFPAVPAEVQGRETPLRRFLEHYGVRESVIDRLEAYGVRTMRDLRLRLEENRLESLLGHAHREDLREIERLVDEQR